ncbi:NAD-dependent epimerase [Bacillus sp. 03113]|uniref:NAD-dependent epimerase n=1 Tax=Bacillus sp. 03113 TaxID=2578211 RepID=UPI0011416CCF|nr:NAD-dependent epimerase [Bacillus sp. 03113]
MSNHKKILVTGCAGFIGFHLSSRLLLEGFSVIGIDNLNDYYDVNLKKARLALLKRNRQFSFTFASIEDYKMIDQIFSEYTPSIVIHLAAQAGVRYSLENPHAYIQSNIEGFMNVLESCKKYPVEHLLYASSSSVYGANKTIPFSVEDPVDHPVSIYAATKKANELMAHTYSYLYEMPTTGLRFFTVYGPWGRPDMALFTFTQAILEGNAIKVFNSGNMNRDFTYIDDIIEGIVRLIPHKPTPMQSENHTSKAPYKIYNIGSNQSVNLLKFISVIEEKLQKKAKKELLPLQPGDIQETYANINDLIKDIGFKPSTSIEEGINKFVDWYIDFYDVNKDG